MNGSAAGSARPVVALVGAFDTKAAEYGFLRERLDRAGVGVLLVDCGVLGRPGLEADVPRAAVAAAGGASLDALVATADRNESMVAMARGAAALVTELVGSGRVSGVMGIGGSNAGYVMSQVNAALPIGVPKVLVATIVAGDTRPYVGTSDLTMIYPVVDIAGLNSISRLILARAADACAGMVHGVSATDGVPDRPAVGCSMFGVTTTCVGTVQEDLQRDGLEVHTFHANGTGGRTLEAMLRSGLFEAVADITTTELADEMMGGVCSAGPDRLRAAAAAGVPQVVSVGALDMVNFGPADTVPERYRDRRLYPHNPAVTLMRTDAAENAALGREMAAKLNDAIAFTEVHVPRLGFSQISVAGGPFHDPVADAALVDALTEHLAPHIPLVVHDAAINDPEFAHAISDALHRSLDSRSLDSRSLDSRAHDSRKGRTT